VSDPKELKLDLVEWEDRPHCIYLDDYRIAGSKPWGGGKIVKTWKVRRSDLEEALRRAAERV